MLTQTDKALDLARRFGAAAEDEGEFAPAGVPISEIGEAYGTPFYLYHGGMISERVRRVHETLGTEMDLHRSFCGDLGITPADLEEEAMAPTTRAYTDFLVRTAAQADFAEVAAALLPCMWGYSEIGRRLAEGPRPGDPRLAAWIDMYASDEFAALADWCREVVDAAGDDAGPRTREAMARAFVASSRYELAFWQMALDERPG